MEGFEDAAGPPTGLNAAAGLEVGGAVVVVGGAVVVVGGVGFLQVKRHWKPDVSMRLLLTNSKSKKSAPVESSWKGFSASARPHKRRIF